MYLKELEKQNKVKIDRISGSTLVLLWILLFYEYIG